MAKDKPATKELPSAFSLFKPSLDAVLKNWDTFFIFAIIPAMYSQFVSRVFDSKAIDSFSALKSIDHIGLYVAVLVVVSLLTLPIIPYLQLKSAQNKRVTAATAFNEGVGFFWRILGLGILVGLLVLGGFLLFVVPGVIMIRRYVMAPYYLIDQDLSIREAMRKSAEASKPYSKYLWFVIGVSGLLSLTSIIPIIGAPISLLLTAAYSCALPFRYLQISKA